MPRSYHQLPSEGWLQRCARCKRRVPRTKLLRQIVHVVRRAGENSFAYSSYDSSYWTCDAVDAGTISQGRSDFWWEVDQSPLAAPAAPTKHGMQTWQGPGTFARLAAADVSSWSSALLAARFGPYQEDGGSSFTISLEGSGPSNDYTFHTLTTVCNARLVGSYDLTTCAAADLAAMTFRFVVTCGASDRWWIDFMQLKHNMTSLPVVGAWHRTTGAALDRAADSAELDVLEVCADCRDKKVDIVNEYDFPTDDMPEIPEDMEVL